jgi:hypothetical protein
MKTRKSKAGNGGWAAVLLAIGLPLVAAVIIMGGCTTFKAIEVTPPTKTVFAQGEGFSYEGLQVTGTTKKGETKDISGDSKINVTGYNPGMTGEQTITVDYRGVTATYTITVVGVETITIDQAPATARQGMDIDRSNLRVTASYGDKLPPRSVSVYEVKISGYNKDTVGTQTVTAECYGKTATFTVTVAALTGIRITKQPAKVSYFSGEPLELEGLEATATWQGAGEAPVEPKYVSGFDTSAQGNQTVIVEALGKQTSFTVTVKEPSDPARWTSVQGAVKNITGIVYGNGKFVAIGYDDKPNEKSIVYSADGTAWTKASTPIMSAFTKNITDIVYGNGKFVAVGGDKPDEKNIFNSTDGIAWSYMGSPVFFDNIKIFFGNGRFIAIGSNMTPAGSNRWEQMESSDGGGWWDKNRIYFDLDTLGSIEHIFFDGSRFIAVGGSGLYAYSADNGKSWKPGEGSITLKGVPVTGVVSGNGRMIGIGPSSAIGWSTDGIVWTDADQQDEELRRGHFTDVAYGFGMFVAVNSRGNIIYSRDGYTWTKVASSTFGSTPIRHVVYGGGKFIAIGDNGRIAYSNKID